VDKPALVGFQHTMVEGHAQKQSRDDHSSVRVVTVVIYRLFPMIPRYIAEERGRHIRTMSGIVKLAE
jgi:hypothetical protein